MNISLAEQMVIREPKGMKGWRMFRIEYGGHAEECLMEGTVWLPSNMDPRILEVLLEAWFEQMEKAEQQRKEQPK